MNEEEFCASKDSIVINCDPCKFEDKHQESSAFCHDCNEFLCHQCLQFHRKFQAFRQHHILRGDLMSRTRMVTKPKPVLKLCDNHHMKEVQFYCRNHRSVFCNLCKFANHPNCECDLINELVSVSEDRTKFDNVSRKIKGIKTEFETLRAEQTEVIDVTAASSRTQRNKLKSLRQKMGALFDNLEHEMEEEKIQEKFYVNDLRESIAMYSDVINDLDSLSVQADDVLKSHDHAAIFAATCKLEENFEDCVTVKDRIAVKVMKMQANKAGNKLLKLNGMCESMIKDIETNRLLRAGDNSDGIAEVSAHENRLPNKQQQMYTVGNIRKERNGEAKQTNKNILNCKSEELPHEKTNYLKDEIPKQGLEKSVPAKQQNHPDETATEGLKKSKQQNHQNEPTKGAMCKQNSVKKKHNLTRDVKAMKTTTVTPGKQDLIFENLNFRNFSYKYINLEGNQCLCDITGSIFLPDGSLILCDRGNSTVLLYDKEFKMTSKHKLKCKVWDVTLTDTGEIVVTLNCLKMLVYLKIISGKLQQQNMTVRLKRVPWGIASYKDKILISYHDNPGNSGIQIRHKLGRVLRNIIVDDKGELLFDSPFYIDVNQYNGDIYVTDSKRNTVTCLSFEGKVLYRIESPVFMWPKKIIHDDQGNFLLCASLANKLLLVKKQSSSDLLSTDKKEDENIKVFLNAWTRPQTVSIRRDDQTMVIGLSSSNMMLILKSST
ncbi:uncharacterized protein LOC132714497 [Ruditapes philippinarum]|uniref:uncharacterized protein LOC132714497 n=1 Tax=Ruditapes philippinarum TaxID=129788 RepID=UPI00295ACA47|nr:uncharacterized protein LOC132714497 [Ruditapes philippinarum]